MGLAASVGNSSYEILFPILYEDEYVDDTESHYSIDETEVERVYQTIKKSLLFQYPGQEHPEIPAKISVSKLYPELLDEMNDTESLLKKVKQLESKKPRFLDGGNKSAEKGTATHLFMQFCDFSRLQPTVESIKEEIGRLTSLKYLSEEIASLIRVDELVKFAKSDLFKDLLSASHLHREFRFNVFLPATQFTTVEDMKDVYNNQEILVQGVIDLCYFDSNGRLILCDYKTDRIPGEVIANYHSVKAMFESAHAQQLKYYSYAIEKIFGKRPDKILIYSLAYGDTFEINV
jgi:ATP-dependent helicase/nuclease subunit A